MFCKVQPAEPSLTVSDSVSLCEVPGFAFQPISQVMQLGPHVRITNPEKNKPVFLSDKELKNFLTQHLEP
jgi:hypothetical protein